MAEAAVSVAASLTPADGDLLLVGVVEEVRDPGRCWRIVFSVAGKEVSTVVPENYGPLQSTVQIADILQQELSQITGGPVCLPGHPHPMEVAADGVSVWWVCPRDRSAPRRVIATFEHT